MKQRNLLTVSVLCLVCAVASVASAEWIWTPEVGKWINPKHAVKETPQEQFDYALDVFNQSDYEKAHAEFSKFLKHYARAKQAPDAQYYLGRCLEAQEEYYKAFQAYRRVLQVYPSSERVAEILERQYQIGNVFFSGQRRKWIGVGILPGKETAVEVFSAIAEDAPFSTYGELAQYKLGQCKKAMGLYEEAVAAFEEFTNRYPESSLVDDARFQIAYCSTRGTFAPAYDQSATDAAVQEIAKFVDEHPDSELVEQATDQLATLKDKRAEHEFQVGEWYESQRAPESAAIYYRSIVKDYPDTVWAAKAAERLQAMP